MSQSLVEAFTQIVTGRSEWGKMSAGRAVRDGRIQRRVGWIELLTFSSLKWSKTFLYVF